MKSLSITALCKEAHRIAISKGFWTTCYMCNGKKIFHSYAGKVECNKCTPTGKTKRNDGELIALMHSELSEALEALRHDNPKSDHIPKFLLIEEELADTIIRICDMAKAYGYRLEDAIKAKMIFNSTREKMHGKKF